MLTSKWSAGCREMSSTGVQNREIIMRGRINNVHCYGNIRQLG